MLLRGRKKVHITAVGVEVNRVILPILDIGADRVVLVENIQPSRDYTPFVDAVAQLLRKKCPNCTVERARIDLFDIEKLIGQLGRMIVMERRENNQVFLNVSVGSRLYDAAGVIASLMYGAIAYYAEAKSYWQDISIYYDRKGNPLGTVREVKRIIEIPQFSIKPPKAEWIRFLAILDERGRRKLNMSQSAVAREMQKQNLLSGCEKGERAPGIKETIRLLSELRRKYIEPMRREGWISIEGQRRSARLVVTEQGMRMLNIFSPVFIWGD